MPPFQSIMEKKVESRECEKEGDNSKQQPAVAVDSKGLVALFQLMSVTGEKHRISSSNNGANVRNSVLKKKLRHRRHRSRNKELLEAKKVSLKPSKLTQAVVDATKGITSEARFSDFSADCARELETIQHTQDTNSAKKEDELQSRAQNKKRKATSSCAQQARNECFNSDLNLDIDLLTDYLEETILLPKKMSYMAELMYT